MCYTIYTGMKTTSREDAHPMYLRYPRVFLYVMIYCPPPNLCENGLGVSLLCTCVAFSPFAKLNQFFRKNIRYVFIIGRFKADMNLTDLMVVQAKVPLN